MGNRAKRKSDSYDIDITIRCRREVNAHVIALWIDRGMKAEDFCPFDEKARDCKEYSRGGCVPCIRRGVGIEIILEDK